MIGLEKSCERLKILHFAFFHFAPSQLIQKLRLSTIVARAEIPAWLHLAVADDMICVYPIRVHYVARLPKGMFWCILGSPVKIESYSETN